MGTSAVECVEPHWLRHDPAEGRLRLLAVPSTGAHGMNPRLYNGKEYVTHDIETAFGASAWHILNAIGKGFRAQADVKGKLAEYFLYPQLEDLKKKKRIEDVEWFDKDGKPDFVLTVGGRSLRLECKNVRSGKVKGKKEPCAIELQKTRNSIGGGPTRGYKIDAFDMVAACLFNQTGEWKFLFSATVNLQRQPIWPDYLQIIQDVPTSPKGTWRGTVAEVLEDLGL